MRPPIPGHQHPSTHCDLSEQTGMKQRLTKCYWLTAVRHSKKINHRQLPKGTMRHIQTSFLLKPEAARKVQKWMLWSSPAEEGVSAETGHAVGQKKMGWGGTLTSDDTFFIMFVTITSLSGISPTPEVWGLLQQLLKLRALQQPFDLSNYFLFTLKFNQSFICFY